MAAQVHWETITEAVRPVLTMRPAVLLYFEDEKELGKRIRHQRHGAQPSTSYKQDNSLEVLRGSICIARKEPIHINYDGSENTEEQTKAKDDNVSNRRTKRWDATKVRILTAILLKGGRAWIDGTIE